MQVVEIIEEIQRLSLDKKLMVVEETIKSIKQEEADHQLDSAVKILYTDYVNDEELTAFTELDLERFYEAK